MLISVLVSAPTSHSTSFVFTSGWSLKSFKGKNGLPTLRQDPQRKCLKIYSMIFGDITSDAWNPRNLSHFLSDEIKMIFLIKMEIENSYEKHGSPIKLTKCPFLAHARPTWSLLDTFCCSPCWYLQSSALRWAFSREKTVHFLTCLLDAAAPASPKEDPRWRLSHSFPIRVHLEFAKCDNPLLPSALKFSSHSEPPAKSWPNFSSTCVGILLSLQKPSSEAWRIHKNETKWQ